MRHWGGDHIFPGQSAKSKAVEPVRKPASHAAGEAGQAPPWIFPTIDTAFAPTHDIDVQRLPDAVAVEAMVLGTGFTKVTAEGVEHIPHAVAVIENDTLPAGTVQMRTAGNEIVGTIINVTDTTNDKPTVSLFDEDAIAAASDEPTDASPAAKTDRKAYLRDYMRARRNRERENKLRATEAGTGATDQ